MLIYQLVIIGFGAVAIVAIVLSITFTADTNVKNEPFEPDGEPITFNDYILGRFRANSFNGTWWSANEIQWRDRANNLVLWNVLTNQTTVLVDSLYVGLISRYLHTFT